PRRGPPPRFGRSCSSAGRRYPAGPGTRHHVPRRSGGEPVTLPEAARALRQREVSSVELTRAALDRIDRLNPTLNAFLTVTAEGALDRAAQADRELAARHDLGPLHGIPIAVK